MSLALKSFQPGTYIELNDTIHGFRKLALVADSGDMYFDLIDEHSTPFPIYEVANPEAAGTVVSWGLDIAANRPAEQVKFAELQARLADVKLDSLTRCRALYFAYKQRDYDFHRALQAGRNATAEVEKSRVVMDRLIHKSASA